MTIYASVSQTCQNILPNGSQILTHSVSCFVVGTPISSNVFGPVPGGRASGLTPGAGVVGFDNGFELPAAVCARKSGMLFLPARSGRELVRG